jgi:hypothetical protein
MEDYSMIGKDELRALALRAARSREDALAALVELAVARWGEQEREPARRHYARRSFGLMLNALSYAPEFDYGADAPHELVAARDAALTDEDLRYLRTGE